MDLGCSGEKYFYERYRDELAMDTTIAVRSYRLDLGMNQDFDISLNLKNLALFNTYLTEFPVLASTGETKLNGKCEQSAAFV
ncbi:MAG: hypothetical protein U5K35_06810 [Rhodohalobacter sp.]|nr:hypothetical protein [Rhodohalobacter sp.]